MTSLEVKELRRKVYDLEDHGTLLFETERFKAERYELDCILERLYDLVRRVEDRDEL